MSATVVSNIRMIALRDLHDVKKEIAAYPDEESLWRTAPGITNPGGTLALHLAGNMRHYFGKVLGRGTYVRNRPAEFAERGVPRTEILARLDAAIDDVDDTLSHLVDEDLSKPFPEDLGGMKLFTGQFLIHCLAHMAYHIGQIDYHRRIITGINKTISAQSIPALDNIPD
jgi:uncharacterized damage-inducible protein DinB